MAMTVKTRFSLVVVALLAFALGVFYADYRGTQPNASAAFDFFKPREETPAILQAEPETASEAPGSGIVPSKVPTSFVDLVKKEKPAVVNISTTQVIKREGFRHPQLPQQRSPFEDFFGDEFYRRFFGDVPPQEFKSKSLGSGFIIDKEGYILTNNHVIENATEIKVKLSNEKEFDAKIIGRDPKTDIALIKIDAKNDLPVVNVGNSDRLQIGEWVVAIGNPFGLEQTVTAGIVSAKGRVIGAGPYDNFIQTDASINPGNSGGPLFNIRGEVIGINTAIISSGQGIGFAIPVNVALEILPQLKEKGRVTRGWLGVMVQHITPDIAESLNRFKRGDVILEFDGQTVGKMRELPTIVAATPVGKKVDVRVLSEGKEKTIRVKIEELEEEKVAAVSQEEAGDFGMKVQELTPELTEYFKLEDTQGVVVVEVDQAGPAADAGIQRGDLVMEVNQKPIRSIDDYRSAVAIKKAGEPSLFWVKRGESTLYFAIRGQKK
jgi:serine protease Do